MKHICSASFCTQGVGYGDLDNLMRNPQDLQFIIELIKIEYPEEYDKEYWQLNDQEKFSLVPVLKERGNGLYKEEKYSDACEKYSTALAYLEQLMLKEKPHDEEWNKCMKLQLPLLLNYAQCKLKMKDYYEVIKHCTTVLQFENTNVKALYRRGKAHYELWNMEEAKRDFKEVVLNDPSLASIVDKHLANILKALVEQHSADTDLYKGKLF